MYSITFECHDRVVSPGRVNAGLENIHGLSEREVRKVMFGETVFLPSRHGYTAIVSFATQTETWEFKGPAESIPSLESMSDDAQQEAALGAWAHTSELRTVR